MTDTAHRYRMLREVRETNLLIEHAHPVARACAALNAKNVRALQRALDRAEEAIEQFSEPWMEG